MQNSQTRPTPRQSVKFTAVKLNLHEKILMPPLETAWS